MAHIITLPISSPPRTIDIAVDFYDASERESFASRYPAEKLDALSRVVAIPVPDLCAYYLYYKMRPTVAGYARHEDLARKWQQALVEFDGEVEFNESSLRLVQRTETNRGTTERLGEAVGLAVASQFHEVHAGDWVRIPETVQHPTLDYRAGVVASDDRRFVEVEFKGATVNDNRLKEGSIPNHKASIRNKKARVSSSLPAGAIRYGTITSLDARSDSIVRCWLVDPPPTQAGDPRRFKVLARVEFFADMIGFLGSRSLLSAALQTRLGALRALQDIERLNGVPLLNGAGEFFAEYTFSPGVGHNPWFASKSTVLNGPAGGLVFPCTGGVLLFVGFREELIGMAARQDFAEIAQYRFPAGSMEKTVHVVVPKGRFDQAFRRHMREPQGSRSKGGAYLEFEIDGIMYYTSSGLIFGILPIPDEWRTPQANAPMTGN